MQIRFARLEDVPRLVEMGRRYHQLTRVRAFDYNGQKVAQTLAAVIQHKTGTHCFFVAQRDDGSLVGGLIGCIEAHIFSDQPVATLVHYDVDPESRMSGAGYRLLLAFKKWAENRKAVEIIAGVNSGVDLQRMDRFLRRLGFDLTGGNYSLRIGG